MPRGAETDIPADDPQVYAATSMREPLVERSHRLRAAVAAAALLIGCASSPPPSAPAPVVSAPPAPSSAPPPTPPPAAAPRATAALDAEIAEVRACPADPRGFDLRCPAHEAFARARTTPQTLAEEELLLSLARGPLPMRSAALYRLAAQPGPRNTDPTRALVAIELARAADGRDQIEARWIGRVVGAVALDTPQARDALRAVITQHPSDFVSGELVTGVGVAHPHDPVALDLVDSFLSDSRVFVLHGVLDAYAETAKRDDARACAAWAKVVSDERFVIRSSALLATTPGCRAHHAAVLAVAEARLAKDPEDGTYRQLYHLCEGPEKKALAQRVTALAQRLLKKHGPNGWDDDLRAIALCDSRGPVDVLRPIIKRRGDLGEVARRVLVGLVGHE